MTDKQHFAIYGVLVVLFVLLGFLWHESNQRDQAAIVATKAALSNQETIDKQAITAIGNADTEEQSSVLRLQKQYNDAKSSQEKVDLFNKLAGTHAIIETAPGINPSVELPETDLSTLDLNATQGAEAEAQITADKIVIAEKDQQLQACKTAEKDQATEISDLRGGSRLKRFLKDAKILGIGIGVGVVADELRKK